MTIQAQILALIRDLQRETGTALLLITHDLGVVAEVADEVAVMYAGRIVERGAGAGYLRRSPASLHLRPDGLAASLAGDAGPARHHSRARCRRRTDAGGCRFAPRCPFAIAALPRPTAPLIEVGARPSAACIRAPLEDLVPQLPRSGRMSTILEARDLRKHFRTGGGLFQKPTIVRAVDGVSFAVQTGETLAIVGESGCGKSTVGRLLLRLIEPTSGAVRSRATTSRAMDEAGLRGLRRDMQIVFQDPFASLNPRMTRGRHRRRAALAARPRHGKERRERVGRAAAHRRPAPGRTRSAIRTNSPAASGSASASPARWRSSPS